MQHRIAIVLLLLTILLLPSNMAQADEEITLIIELEKGITQEDFLLQVEDYGIEYNHYSLTLFNGLILKIKNDQFTKLTSLSHIDDIWFDEPLNYHSGQLEAITLETSATIAMLDIHKVSILQQSLPGASINTYESFLTNTTTATLLIILEEVQEDIVYIPIIEISSPIQKALAGLRAKGTLPVLSSSSCPTEFEGPGYIQKETHTTYLCSDTHAISLTTITASIMTMHPDWSLQQLYLSLSHMGMHLDETEGNLPNYNPPQADILLIDGAGYELFGADTNPYEALLYNLGYSVAHWSTLTHGEPSIEVLQKYPLLIWYTGAMYLPAYSFPGDSVTTLMAYLTEGGSLLLSGQQIGYMLGNEHRLFKEYLKVESFNDEYSATMVNNIPLGSSLTNYWPQSLTTTADNVFHYDTGSIAGIIIEEPFKLAYLAFSFESLENHDQFLEYLLNHLAGR